MKMRRRAWGLTLTEIVVAVAVMAIVSLSASYLVIFLAKQSNRSNEREFAAQKASQMMEELRAFVERLDQTNSSSINGLDAFDDGNRYNFLLTTDKAITDPGDPLSGNPQKKYQRQVFIIKVPDDSHARRVEIYIYRVKDKELLASTVGVLRTGTPDPVPTQVYDIYFPMPENVLLDITSPVQAIINDLKKRNPGLDFRTHYLTRLAYGRDPYYKPVINDATPSHQFNYSGVYYYLGSFLGYWITTQPIGYFYTPAWIRGKMAVEGIANPDPNAPEPYTEADQFNHAMRYPDELAEYGWRKPEYENRTTNSPYEISVRMFLEQLLAPNSNMKNALILNPNPATMPVPPMRNTSDPAKDPSLYPNLRAIANPERLQYSSSQQVAVRVYAFEMPAGASAVHNIDFITLKISSVAASSTAGMHIKYLAGDGSTPNSYTWLGDATINDPTFLHNPPDPNNVVARIQDGVLTVVLPNTKTVSSHHPGNDGGLCQGMRPYQSASFSGIEYIACPTRGDDPNNPFNRDLTTQDNCNNPVPKNTARWRITFPANFFVPNSLLAVQTQLGNEPANPSRSNWTRSYAWLDIPPPETERYQFIGDPRFEPYADVQAHRGFNWFFSAQPNSGDYSFKDGGYAVNGWLDDPEHLSNMDIPRLYSVWRDALLRSTSIMSNAVGKYPGIGGIIPGYEGVVIYITGAPYGNPNVIYLHEGINNFLTGAYAGYAGFSGMPIISRSAPRWDSLPWLGELYPDDQFGNWTLNGNLAPGAGNFFRRSYLTSIYPEVNAYPVSPDAHYDAFCLSAVLNSAVRSHGFSPDGPASAAIDAQGRGDVVEMTESLKIPLLNTFKTNWCLVTNDPDPTTPFVGWNGDAYVSSRTTITPFSVYYNSTISGCPNTATMRMTSPMNGNQTAYVYYSGTRYSTLDNTLSMSGRQYTTNEIGSLVHTFLKAGLLPATDPGRISQLPLVEISSPTAVDEFRNPSSIHIQWRTRWLRWDGQKYLPEYADGFSESTPLVYSLKYSADNGGHWKDMFTELPTNPGDRDVTTISSTFYNWTNAGSLPRGNYQIRVEAFRSDLVLHYAYHIRKIYIQR